MNKYTQGLEPTRVIGWITTALVLVGSIVKQISDSYDEGTGWVGLGFATIMVISTELVRSKVTSMKGLQSIGNGVGPTDGR